MNEKLAELNATIEAKATKLGLNILWSGPDSNKVLDDHPLKALAVPSIGETNLVPRAVYFFAVAEGAQ